MLLEKSNKELLTDLNEYVYGHEKAKKALITMVSRSRIRYMQKYIDNMPLEKLIPPLKCLILGESGTGKTYLVECLAKILKFPILKVDATKFNPTGASGGIKADQLRSMIISEALKFGQDNDLMNCTKRQIIDRMVVFVDEFDKISSKYDGNGSGNWNNHVQSHFLTLFENYEDLSGVSWVFSGAFSGIETKQNVKKTGFISPINDENTNIVAEITDEDIINFGLIPEIVGRINQIITLDKLTIDNYCDIIKQHILPNKLRDLEYYGIYDMNIPDEDILTIAQQAVDSRQGVRYIKRHIENYFLDLEFNYENI